MMITVPSERADSIFALYKARQELHDSYQSGDQQLIAQKIEAYLSAEKRRRESEVA